MMAKFVFLDGCDGCGKTYKANQLLKTDNKLKYFRSNYQRDSVFADKPVNLEQSMEHDWRVLHDFSTQVLDTIDSTILVDRSFISSYVYSKVIRNTDLKPYLLEYINMFKDTAEFWIFIRYDSHMSAEELLINEEFKKIDELLKSHNCVVNNFIRTDTTFKTDSFLDLDTEIKYRRFDCDYYSNKIFLMLDSMATVGSKKPALLITDLDGTIITQHQNFQYANEDFGVLYSQLQYNIGKHIIITGREYIDKDRLALQLLRFSYRVDTDYIIHNNRNLGLSSGVLKKFCLKYIRGLGYPIYYIDDRYDIISRLYPTSDIKKYNSLYYAGF